jgi:hypothetical protein
MLSHITPVDPRVESAPTMNMKMDNVVEYIYSKRDTTSSSSRLLLQPPDRQRRATSALNFGNCFFWKYRFLVNGSAWV